jgi:hypothetical protein
MQVAPDTRVAGEDMRPEQEDRSQGFEVSRWVRESREDLDPVSMSRGAESHLLEIIVKMSSRIDRTHRFSPPSIFRMELMSGVGFAILASMKENRPILC